MVNGTRKRWAGWCAAAALVAAVGGWATEASAQRSIMVTSGDDGQETMMSFVQPDLDLVRRPDYALSDLRTMTDLLALSEPQQNGMRGMIEAYLDALRAIPLDVNEGGFMARVGGGGGPDDDAAMDAARSRQERARQATRDAFENAGVDYGLLESGQLSMGTSVGIGMSVDEEGGEPVPDLNVQVSLGPAEGVHLPQETMDKLAAIAEEVAGKIEAIELEGLAEQMAAMQADMAMGRGDREPGDEMAQRRAEIEAMRQAIEAYLKAKRSLRNETTVQLQSLLSEAQLAAWPRVERVLRRERTLPLGELAGESIDLLALLASAELSAESALDAVRTSYENAIDHALQRRNRLLETHDFSVDRAIDRGDAKEVVDLVEKMRRARMAVRDVNLQHLELLVSALGERGAAFETMVREKAFPRVHAETPAVRAFRKLEASEAISDDARATVNELHAAYAIERGDIDRAIESMIVRDEPKEFVANMATVLEYLDPEVADSIRFDRRTVVDGLERRLGIDRRYMESLYGVLPPGLVERMPKIPDVAVQEPVTAERFFGGDS